MFVLFLILYVTLSVGGLVLFKLGSAEKPVALSLRGGGFSFQIALKSIIGLLCYVVSFLLYMYLVSIYNLNYIAPIATGLSYVLTLVSSYTIFKEPFTTFQIIGVALILIGIILMNIKTN